MEETILCFIDGFRDVKDFFLTGYCYWFAVILQKRFVGGDICYMPISNHFIYKIGYKYYDAQGEVHPSENVYMWTFYTIFEPEESGRIMHDCIFKLDDSIDVSR